MDQYVGILRVVTSTAVTGFRETFYGEFVSVTNNVTERNVNLYCVDLTDWTVKASVIGFAPAGEEATSVLFDGVNAYVCTAEVITLTDPVYFSTSATWIISPTPTPEPSMASPQA